jgi:predicted short-subunit dehydrogenase-like oxidoreductase (DUF2520 family)
MLIRSLHGTPVILSDHTRKHKTLYHITAVIASNYLSALAASVQDAAIASQIDARLFSTPIIETTLDNAMMQMTRGDLPLLSGPISRADIQTVQRHLNELHESPSLKRSYCLMGIATADLALRSKQITRIQHKKICSILQEALQIT